MADDASTWSLIHAERAKLADLIEGLTPEQWNTPSLCAGWSVGQLAGHILAGAEQTPSNFMTGMVKSGVVCVPRVASASRLRKSIWICKNVLLLVRSVSST